MIDKEKSKQLYLGGMNMREVATAMGCSKSRMAYIIKQEGISRPREPRKHLSEAKAHKCEDFSHDFLNFLDGLMISDGSLKKPKPNAGGTTYAQHCVNEEFLLHVQEEFNKNGLISKISKEKRKGKTTKGLVLKTPSYDKLLKQYKRWHKNGIKIVPEDIDLTNTKMLKNWIYGDGTLVKTVFRFCTDSFSETEIKWLIDQFKKKLDLNFTKTYMGNTKENKPKYRLSICKKGGVLNLFKYTGKSELKCFLYKWRLSDV